MTSMTLYSSISLVMGHTYRSLLRPPASPGRVVEQGERDRPDSKTIWEERSHDRASALRRPGARRTHGNSEGIQQLGNEIIGATLANSPVKDIMDRRTT